MRLVRFRGSDGAVRWGAVQGDQIAVLRGAFGDLRPTGERVAFDPAALLAPVEPSKIVALGQNYPKHAAELGNAVPEVPKLFLKPSTSVVGPGVAIEIPPLTTRVDPEAELAVVIGRRLSRASPAEAMRSVLGYTCLNDVTCRDFQRSDVQFTRAKGFDTFCPIGPWIDTDLDPSDLEVRTVVNGEIRASGRTSHMVFRVPEILSFVSNVMTLLPGDVIATGTPPGVAPIVAGDVVRVEIEGLGALENPVRDREDR